ncbi:MAG: hypothetical protein HC825_00155 [Oscillatoriales cyanobacterium RM1_1_9]|nr:hypothetical protein [Oscillatoriales cyanobacterium RM2_1_1]NJO70542.1 hypothetical protein [Oscillatoriales cyanobacterium RM1_1_9]
MFNLAAVSLSAFRTTANITAGIAQGVWIMAIGPRHLREQEVASIRARKQVREIQAQRNSPGVLAKSIQPIPLKPIVQLEPEQPMATLDPGFPLENNAQPDPEILGKQAELERVQEQLQQIQKICRDFRDRRKDTRNWIEANRLLEQLQRCF